MGVCNGKTACRAESMEHVEPVKVRRDMSSGKTLLEKPQSPSKQKSLSNTSVADMSTEASSPASEMLQQKQISQSKQKSLSNTSVGDVSTIASTSELRSSRPSLDKQMFIFEKAGRIKDYYEIEKKPLGVGGYGSVCKGKDKKTSARRAIKAISKSQMKSVKTFKQEISIMKMLDHPNIIKLYETFEDSRNVYLVMELCTGGELFDKIIEAGNFSEIDAAILLQQIIRALYYMHERSVCHRDLKPENFLFQSRGPIAENTLKIIDFGLSCYFMPNEKLRSKAGTPYYVAPQVLAGEYDQSSDMWSCGVIMYVLLCGYPPFHGDTDAEVLKKVRQGNFTFKFSHWKHVTEDAKDLIRCMLKMDPSQRFTAEQALKHPWIQGKAPKATPGLSLQTDFVDHLRNFQSANHLKKAALQIIAGQLSEKQIKAMRDTFVALDANGDGLLTTAEIKVGLKNGGLEELPIDLNQIVEDMDSNGSGVIDYTEFLAATLEKKLYLQEDVCWKAFATFDQNGDGQISLEELKQVLQSDSVEEALGAECIAELMQEVDANGDGTIDFNEFMAMMRGQGSPCHKVQDTPAFGIPISEANV